MVEPTCEKDGVRSFAAHHYNHLVRSSADLCGSYIADGLDLPTMYEQCSCHFNMAIHNTRPRSGQGYPGGGYLVLGNDGHLLESVQKVHAIFKSHRKALKIVVFCIIYNSMNILYLLSKKTKEKYIDTWTTE